MFIWWSGSSVLSLYYSNYNYLLNGTLLYATLDIVFRCTELNSTLNTSYYRQLVMHFPHLAGIKSPSCHNVSSCPRLITFSRLVTFFVLVYFWCVFAYLSICFYFLCAVLMYLSIWARVNYTYQFKNNIILITRQRLSFIFALPCVLLKIHPCESNLLWLKCHRGFHWQLQPTLRMV